MDLFPAVDIRGGKAVRLEQGDFEREKVYDEDPVDAARRWIDAGADHLHMVDLDGAKMGRPVNLVKISQVVQHAQERGVFVQVGGGLRTSTDIAWVSHTGVDRVLLGSAALLSTDILESAIDSLGEKVAVSIDAKDGVVMVEGWNKEDERTTGDAFKEMSGRGVKHFVFTSISQDGTMEGPNLAEIERVSTEIDGRFLYAGGIGSVEHLESIAALEIENLDGVIAGRALFEDRFTIKEGQSALKGT